MSTPTSIKDRLATLIFSIVVTAFLGGVFIDKSGTPYMIIFFVYAILFIFEVKSLLKMLKKLKIEEVQK